jgi:hypothetical protein
VGDSGFSSIVRMFWYRLGGYIECIYDFFLKSCYLICPMSARCLASTFELDGELNRVKSTIDMRYPKGKRKRTNESRRDSTGQKASCNQ